MYIPTLESRALYLPVHLIKHDGVVRAELADQGALVRARTITLFGTPVMLTLDDSILVTHDGVVRAELADQGALGRLALKPRAAADLWSVRTQAAPAVLSPESVNVEPPAHSLATVLVVQPVSMLASPVLVVQPVSTLVAVMTPLAAAIWSKKSSATPRTAPPRRSLLAVPDHVSAEAHGVQKLSAMPS